MPPAGKEGIRDPHLVEPHKVDAAAPTAPAGRPGPALRLNAHKPQHNCATHFDCVTGGASLKLWRRLRGLATHRAATWTSPIRFSATAQSTWLSCRDRSSRSTRSMPSRAMYRFFRRLASFCRLIRFDHRGMGMSSRIGADKITPACWAEDVVAVMDAVGCERATIFGSGFTAMSALFLAADRPERVANLVIVNGAARALWAPDYEAGAKATGPNPFTTVVHRTRCRRAGFRRAAGGSTLGRRRSTHSARGGTRRAIARRRRAWPEGRARHWSTPTCVTSSRKSPHRH